MEFNFVRVHSESCLCSLHKKSIQVRKKLQNTVDTFIIKVNFYKKPDKKNLSLIWREN